MGPRFRGRQYKGAMRSHRENLRAEAQFRQNGFETDVRRIMSEQNVEEPTASIVAAGSRRLARLKTARAAS